MSHGGLSELVVLDSVRCLREVLEILEDLRIASQLAVRADPKAEELLRRLRLRKGGRGCRRDSQRDGDEHADHDGLPESAAHSTLWGPKAPPERRQTRPVSASARAKAR